MIHYKIWSTIWKIVFPDHVMNLESTTMYMTTMKKRICFLRIEFVVCRNFITKEFGWNFLNMILHWDALKYHKEKGMKKKSRIEIPKLKKNEVEFFHIFILFCLNKILNRRDCLYIRVHIKTKKITTITSLTNN